MPVCRIIHPEHSDQHFTIKEWLKKFGSNVQGRCPVCDGVVRIRAASAPTTVTHFSHDPGTHCPTVDERHDPYRLLQSGPFDKDSGETIKAYASSHCRDLYLSCQALAPGLNVEEFCGLLKCASSHDVWAYRGLTPEYLPYVLVTLERFVVRPPHRPRGFCFAFPPQASALSDLWNLPAHAPRVLWKIFTDTGDVERILISTSVKPGEFGWIARARPLIR